MPGKTKSGGGHAHGISRFNEAPAKCRGKRALKSTSSGPASPSFNEAPAKCRGKRAPELKKPSPTLKLQ